MSETQTDLTPAKLPAPARMPREFQADGTIAWPAEDAGPAGMGTCPMSRTPTIIMWRGVSGDQATTRV